MSPCAVRYKGEERTYVPEEIICLVLKHLAATAEKQLMGRRITQARLCACQTAQDGGLHPCVL